jgi:hypothetical protein
MKRLAFWIIKNPRTIKGTLFHHPLEHKDNFIPPPATAILSSLEGR